MRAAAAANAGKSPIAAAALFENFAAGLGTAAFLAFLMSVCERRYAATQFALLSAIFALSRWAAGLMSGVLAERLGFAAYFLLTFLLGLPAYLLLPRMRNAGVERVRRLSRCRAPSPVAASTMRTTSTACT